MQDTYPETPSIWVQIAKFAFTAGLIFPTMSNHTTGPVEPMDDIKKDVCGAMLLPKTVTACAKT